MTVTTVIHPAESFTAQISAFVSHVADAAQGIVRAYRNRSQAALLAGADARTLADLGLTHSDVRDAFAQPLWRDPTELLGQRVAERRRVRR